MISNAFEDEFCADTVGCTAVCVLVRKQDWVMPGVDVLTATGNKADSCYLFKNPKEVKDNHPYTTLIRKNMF